MNCEKKFLIIPIIFFLYGIILNGESMSYAEENKMITTNLKTKESIVKDINNYWDINLINPYIPDTVGKALMPRKIIGIDDRKKVVSSTVHPYNAICYLETEFDDGTAMRGTAFMISDNIAMTAGHCVVGASRGANTIKIYPGRESDTIPYGYANALSYTTAQAYRDGFSVEYDWAILVLDNNIRK